MNRLRDRVLRARSAFLELSPLVDHHRGTLVLIVLASAGAGLAEAGVLALLAHTAAMMSATGAEQSFSFGPLDIDAPTPSLLAVAAVLAVTRLLLQMVVARLPARLSGIVQTRLRGQLVDAFLGSSWSEQSKEKEGHFQELMGVQVNQAGNAVLMLAAGLAAALEFIILVVAALIFSIGASLVVIATVIILLAALRPLSRQVRHRAAATSEASAQQAWGVSEMVRLAEEWEVFGVADAVRSRTRSLIDSLERHFVATRSLSRIVPVTFQSAVMILLVLGLSILYATGTTRLAELGAVILLLVRASAYGQNLQVAYQGLGEALPYLHRVTGAVERYRTHSRHVGDRPITAVRTVEFDDVSFEYKPGTPVLLGISFSISAGEAIGIVGPSGAGKSSLLQLLIGLQKPSAGGYRVNDLSVSVIEDVSWHRKVAFLPQEPRLLSGTVWENIRFYRDWLDDGDVQRAARLAHIHEDVIAWRDGYQTVVGQRADAVSGGQRQRLCLARALAGQPELLILDEPTSSLDLRSERLIQDSLEGLRGELILILVAHRTTTLSLCDRVMVLRGGRLEAFASAGELYDSNDFFHQSVDLAVAGGP